MAALRHATADGGRIRVADSKISCPFCRICTTFTAEYAATIEDSMLDTREFAVAPLAALRDITAAELAAATRDICDTIGDFPPEYIDEEYINAAYASRMIGIIRTIQTKMRGSMLIAELEQHCPDAAEIIRNMGDE